MAKATRYTLEQVQVAQKQLRNLAEKTSGKTRAEAVEFLAPDIRRAVHQGHSQKKSRIFWERRESLPLW